MNAPFDVRHMGIRDVPLCDALRRTAGWNQTIGDWERILTLSPGGCFVATSEGAVVGSVTTIRYGCDIGWIGMLLVHPDVRGRGIGKTLLSRAIQHLQELKIRSIKLDATPQGEPLYRSLGFREEWPLARFKRAVADIPKEAAEQFEVLPVDDLERCTALDSDVFGANRGELLREILRGSRLSIGIPGATGIEAFGVLREGSNADYIGPVVARSRLQATTIINGLIRRANSAAIYWDIPLVNEAAVSIAADFGFITERPLLRMYLGEPLKTADATRMYGIVDPALG